MRCAGEPRGQRCTTSSTRDGTRQRARSWRHRERRGEGAAPGEHRTTAALVRCTRDALEWLDRPRPAGRRGSRPAGLLFFFPFSISSPYFFFFLFEHSAHGRRRPGRGAWRTMSAAPLIARVGAAPTGHDKLSNGASCMLLAPPLTAAVVLGWSRASLEHPHGPGSSSDTPASQRLVAGDGVPCCKHRHVVLDSFAPILDRRAHRSFAGSLPSLWLGLGARASRTASSRADHEPAPAALATRRGARSNGYVREWPIALMTASQPAATQVHVALVSANRLHARVIAAVTRTRVRAGGERAHRGAGARRGRRVSLSGAVVPGGNN